MKLTKRNQLKVPRELREEKRVVITSSSRPNTLLMFSHESWVVFSEKLSEACKERESQRKVMRHYLVHATELWPNSQNYVCIGDNELLDWFCDRPGVRYEISYSEDNDCYIFKNVSVENDSTEWVLP